MVFTTGALETGQPSSATATGRRARIATILSIVAAAVLVGLPLLTTPLPPLLDYPNHLARSFIVQHWADDPMLQHWYRITWQPVPGMGHDLVMAALTPFLDVETAGRVLLALIQLSTLSGVAALHRALWARWSLWPLAALPFLWHGAFMAGFTSFALGLGLAFWGAASWRWLDTRPMTARIAAAVAIGLAIYLTHVFALCCFLALVGSFESWRSLTAPRGDRLRSIADATLLMAATLAVPVLLFVWLQTTTEGSVLWGEWKWASRVRGLQMPLMGEFRDLRLALSGAVAALALLLVATRTIRIAWCLLPAALLVSVLFMVLPGTIFSNGAVPERLAVLLVLMAVAATDFQARHQTMRWAVPAIIAAFSVLQSASVAVAWQQSKTFTDGMRHAVETIPRGSRLLVVQPWPRGDVRYPFLTARDRLPGWYFALNDFPALMHMASLAVPRGIFVPLLFSHPQKQILAFAPGLGGEQGKPFGLGEVMRPDARPGEIVTPAFAHFDSLLVLYGELLSDAQRAQLQALHPSFDNGSILVVPLR